MSTFKRAVFALAVNLAGCGGGADSCSGCDGDGGVRRATLQVDAGTTEEREGVEQKGTAGAGRNECVEVTDETLVRWPSAKDATEEALARWGKRLPFGRDCRLIIVVSDRHKIAQTVSGDGLAAAHINPQPGIVEGPTCSGKQLLLVDVIAHELGHAFGYRGHTETGAMGRHTWCSLVFPTADELSKIGEIGKFSFRGPLK